LLINISTFQGKVEEALRAFEALVNQYPQSPRARYGKAQVLKKAINVKKDKINLFYQ